MTNRDTAELMINKIINLAEINFARKTLSAMEDAPQVRHAIQAGDAWIDRIKTHLLDLVGNDNDSHGEDQ